MAAAKLAQFRQWVHFHQQRMKNECVALLSAPYFNYLGAVL